MNSVEQRHKDLNKALNLSLLGLVGAFIPFLGLIFAIVGINLANNIFSNEDTASKIRTVKTVATIAIILSLISGYLWYNYYNNQNIQAESAIRQYELEETSKQRQLDSCLSVADANYQTNWTNACESNAKRVEDGRKSCYALGAGYSYCNSLWGEPDRSPSCSLPLTSADTVNGYHKDQKDECYRRFSAR